MLAVVILGPVLHIHGLWWRQPVSAIVAALAHGLIMVFCGYLAYADFGEGPIVDDALATVWGLFHGALMVGMLRWGIVVLLFRHGNRRLL